MEIIKLITLLLGTALLFISCSAKAPPTLSYQERAFRAHISWQTNGISVTALLTSVPSASDSPDASKTVTLEITSPPSLDGITICQKNGCIRTRLDDLDIDSPYATRLLAVSELFEIDATVNKSTVTELDGKKLNLIEAFSENGKKYSIYLFPTQSCREGYAQR